MKNSNYIKCNDYFVFDIPKEYQHCSGIYKITNDKTKYIYVGRTNDFKERYLNHFYAFTKNKNNSKIKYNSYLMTDLGKSKKGILYEDNKKNNMY